MKLRRINVIKRITRLERDAKNYVNIAEAERFEQHAVWSRISAKKMQHPQGKGKSCDRPHVSEVS